METLWKMAVIVKIDKNGGPEVLKIENIVNEKTDSDEVLVENKAIGLNYIDTYHRSGLYPLKLPSGIGLEAAGIIKKIIAQHKESDFSKPSFLHKE